MKRKKEKNLEIKFFHLGNMMFNASLVAKQAGHTTPVTTIKYYFHPTNSTEEFFKDFILMCSETSLTMDKFLLKWYGDDTQVLELIRIMMEQRLIFKN